MVAAILSRVLSRTSLFQSTTPEIPSKDQQRRQSKQDNMETQHNGPHPVVHRKSSSISFEEGIQDKPSIRSPHSPTTRKHSYASIKEDAEMPQSFTIRRLDSDASLSIERRRSSELKSPPLDARSHTHFAQYFSENEYAVEDTEGEEFDSCTNSDDSSVPPRSSTGLESMPDEILDLMFSLLTLKADKDRLVDPKVDLFNLLLVSRPLHAAALRVLYRHVRVPQSKAFFKFHNALLADDHLGNLVQCLDFSHYSSIGFGRAKSTTIERPYLTPKTLKACLEKTTNLKALLAHEHVDDELDVSVMEKLFSMPSLRALDLCACSSKNFTNSMNTVSLQLGHFLSIERLSLHECTVLRPQVFEAILPRLQRLTHLDLAHTMVNDRALMSIPRTARITHLNLERCNQVTGRGVVDFLTNHPAATDSIIYLNLMADASRYRLLDEDEVTELLPLLPVSLRSLNLGGARVNSSHVCALRRLATHLEELGLKGANLSLGRDVMHILSHVSIDCSEELQHSDWRHSLRYIDLTDVKSVNQMSLNYSPTPVTRIESMPLEVIELGDSVVQDISKRLKNVKDPAWRVQELGRRGWFVRQARLVAEANGTPEDGHRKWKMGARWWGMRKIPMFEQDTGGMYGYFMFKRA